MKRYFACLLMASALFSGCASTKSSLPAIGLPQEYVYPVMDNAFLNKAIARHKVDSKKDRLSYFTMPEPKSVELCGLSQDFIRARFLVSKKDSKQFSKASAKGFARAGLENSSLALTSDASAFKVLESTCPVAGQSGSVTVRYKTEIDEKLNGEVTKTTMLSVGILSFGPDLQPELYASVTKVEGADLAPILFYTNPRSEILMASFSQILDQKRITLKETGDEGTQTVTQWIDGNLASIGHLKNGQIHGKMIIFPQKSLGGNEMVPGTTICYKHGAVIKTTGPCIVD
jgi:hypothetical protein